MSNIIDCLAIRDKWLESMSKQEIDKMAIFIQVGNREDSNSYINSKKEQCAKYNIDYTHIQKSDCITQKELISLIQEYNDCDKVMAIMVQLPLPKHINEDAVINAIDPKKDLDGFTSVNKGKLLLGDKSAIIPCTPYGIERILESIEFDCKGKNAVVIGRSNIVGKPMVQLLINKGATVTCCNSNTPQEKVKELIFASDLLITAIDKPCLYDVEYFKEENLAKLNNVIAIDVGIFRIDGKLKGNISRDIYPHFKAITPVPKGVGPMTVAGVIANMAKCYELNK